MANRSDDSSPAIAHQPAGALITLLGFLSIVTHSPALSNVQGLAAIVLTVVLPSSLGLILIAVGYVTARGELVDPEDAGRLAAWVLGGMVGFLIVGLWIIVLDHLLGQPVPFGFLLTVNAVTLGGIVGSVIGLYDARRRENIRELERRERDLEEQNQRLDEFASVVSHDLRNPLNVAQGRLEMAREDTDHDQLDAVADAHDRMETLIEDMRALSRAGKTVGETEPVVLAELVEACWRNVDTTKATLMTETQVTIHADKTRLQQLLENLVRNSIDHGGSDVTITIGDLPDGFYLEDDGPGIPEDQVEKILQPGYSTTDEGTGFGLSIVRDIVQAHGWEIEVTEGSDGGARFEFRGVDTE